MSTSYHNVNDDVESTAERQDVIKDDYENDLRQGELASDIEKLLHLQVHPSASSISLSDSAVNSPRLSLSGLDFFGGTKGPETNTAAQYLPYPNTSTNHVHASPFALVIPQARAADAVSAPPDEQLRSRLRDKLHLGANGARRDNLLSCRSMVFLLLWYVFSFCTLFMNKYILSNLGGEPSMLASSQMVVTAVCGFFKMYIPCCLYRHQSQNDRPQGFFRNMLILGVMRFSTVILGLVSLKHIAVSFTETIKSSAPLFTVLIARVILNERTGLWINLALIPVMGGLALTSCYELSFTSIGFGAAIATNLVDCLQNVFSKKLLSASSHRYSPPELQFYTSLAAVVLLIPSWWLIDNPFKDGLPDSFLIYALILDGVFFHLQSITAYALMGRISPVTHSVANTAKRALLIWLSVLIFNNPVTLLSGIGTIIVVFGVFLYNRACEHEQQQRRSQETGTEANYLPNSPV